jgi:hypothetical protein
LLEVLALEFAYLPHLWPPYFRQQVWVAVQISTFVAFQLNLTLLKLRLVNIVTKNCLYLKENTTLVYYKGHSFNVVYSEKHIQCRITDCESRRYIYLPPGFKRLTYLVRDLNGEFCKLFEN